MYLILCVYFVVLGFVGFEIESWQEPEGAEKSFMYERDKQYKNIFLGSKFYSPFQKVVWKLILKKRITAVA